MLLNNSDVPNGTVSAWCDLILTQWDSPNCSNYYFTCNVSLALSDTWSLIKTKYDAWSVKRIHPVYLSDFFSLPLVCGNQPSALKI